MVDITRELSIAIFASKGLISGDDFHSSDTLLHVAVQLRDVEISN